MIDTSIKIRSIRAHEGAAMRAIRERALADTPEAFGQTLAQARALSDEEYTRRAQASALGEERIFIAAEDGGDEWIGMIAGHNEGDRVALLSMWVAPERRGAGLGKKLVLSLLGWAAAKSAHEAYLFVGERNVPARALYTSMGFAPTGHSEPLPWNPAIIDIEMKRIFSPEDTWVSSASQPISPLTDCAQSP